MSIWDDLQAKQFLSSSNIVYLFCLIIQLWLNYDADEKTTIEQNWGKTRGLCKKVD